MVGLIVRSDDPALVHRMSAVGDTSTSPFVIAINNAGVRGLDSVFNAVIVIAVFEVANSAIYTSTRTLAALAAGSSHQRRIVAGTLVPTMGYSGSEVGPAIVPRIPTLLTSAFTDSAA